MNLEHYLTQNMKINSKQITDIDVRAKTIQLLEEITEGILYDLGVKQRFLRHNTNSIIPQRKQIDGMNFSQFKNFCTSKDTIKKTKRQTTDRRNSLQI